MGRASRNKGLGGEREVAAVFEGAGFHVRGLEAGGDWFCVKRATSAVVGLHMEVKRAEHLRVMEWVRQAEAEAAPGAIPVVAFRQNREPWRVVLTLEALLGLMA